MSYMELCETVLKSAEKLGAKEAEALILARRGISVEIERAEIKTCSDVTDSGLGVRTITNKKIGFAFTNILNQKEAEKTAERAVKASKASPKDENWNRLPEKHEYPTVKDVYDKKITKFTSDEAVVLCQTMMNTAHSVDKRVLPAFGGAEVNISENICLNSHGISVSDKGTVLVCALGTMARSKTVVSPVCFEFKASRKFETDPKWVAEEAARLAVDAINVGKAEAGKFPILLDPFALQAILTYTLIQSVKGDNVARGKSIFKDKIGKEVAGENVTIYDDGTLTGGLQSGKMDLEGVPRQKTPIIDKGILRGFLYNNYWARVEGKRSTGNASRGGGGLNLPPYGTVPNINRTNIKFEAGTLTEEELLEQAKDGYYVRGVQGAHQSNPETGEFSVALAPAWRIQKGKITHAVKGVMIAGNVYDMLTKISALGKETRQVGTFITPKVVISELNVITK
ncbi:MAG: TldD/PmbA family protein [Candidatus Bathyarchaeota archaeon]|jgi:PmbA protein